MGFAIGEIHELGQVAIAIKANVDFQGSFGCPELGPRENGKAKVNHCCVKQIQLAFEFELVPGGKLVTAMEQLVKDCLIEFSRLLFVHSGQSSPGTGLESQVV